MSEPHVHTLRVYYEDTDLSGTVYHAGYLRFLERGRTEFLRSLGIAQSELRRDADGLVFVVARLAIDYLRPALMDDLITVTTTLDKVGGATMRLRQVAARGGTVLVRAEVLVAAVRDGRAVRLSDKLRAALGRVHE